MDPRAGLDACGISRLTGIRSPDRPAPSKSIYQLSYPGPRSYSIRIIFKPSSIQCYGLFGIQIFRGILVNVRMCLCVCVCVCIYVCVYIYIYIQVDNK